MTVEQKDRITALRNSGKSYAEIARELGLGKGNVGGEQRPGTKAYKAIYHFADEPDEGVVDEVLRILMNVR